MPSNFDSHKADLALCLRERFFAVRTLNFHELKKFKGKRIVAGWRIELHEESCLLDLLIDSAFPFSHIQVAYVGKDRYLSWPHVEENNYLCLPIEGWLPSENISYSVDERVRQAVELIKNCSDTEYIKSESAAEFVSYWARDSRLTLTSIIDLENRHPRRVTVASTVSLQVIGENEQAVATWLEKQNIQQVQLNNHACFCFISKPPTLPLPKNSKYFFDWLLTQEPQLASLIKRVFDLKQDFFLVLAFENEKGVGLIGARLSKIPKNGFTLPSRKGGSGHKSALAILKFVSRYEAAKVMRADGAWVHGRGHNENYNLLKNAKVILLGCGSLGSHVANMLAQSGVGSLTLVDPECLDYSNVGRHILGVNSVNKSKAEELKCYLSEHYPHSSFQAYACSVEKLSSKDKDFFADAALIISCIAEPAVDLSFNAWYMDNLIRLPIVYGWIGTKGCTGIALALNSSGPSLSCFIEPDGAFKKQSVEFDDDGALQAEPGCGTMFQPYGPLTTNQVALLVGRLSLDLITADNIKTRLPLQRVYACSTKELEQLGGQWTKEHTRYRPSGYDGSMEYELKFDFCGDCINCKSH